MRLNPNQWFLKLAVTRTLRRKAPDRFTLSTSNDYFVSVLKPHSDAENIIIESLDGNTVHGRQWLEKEFKTPIKFDLAELSDFKFEVSHFYGHSQIRNDSLSDFWKSQLSMLAFRTNFSEKFRQRRYNSNTKFRHDRIDVLKKLIELRLNRAIENDVAFILGDEGWSSVSLFEQLYGQRVFGHPSFKSESSRFDLILESLVTSGDVEEMPVGNYKPTGQALSTIAQYEQTERRHQDSLQHNNRLVWLTVVLAVAAVAQVITTLTSL